MVTSPPRLSISKETPSGPGAFPDLSSDIAVMISSSVRGEDRSWSERVESDEGGWGWGVIMGRSSLGMTSMSIWQFTTSWKCSAQRFNLSPSLCRILPSLATRLDEAGLKNFFPKRRRSLIREPPLPCCSAARARHSAFDARSLHQALRALSAAALASFLRWSYLVFRRVMSCGHALYKRIQASFFFLDRLRTSLVIQSGSLLIGAGGRDLQAFWMDDLQLSH